MTVFLGVVFTFALGVLWLFVSGRNTGTLPQSTVALGFQIGLNYGSLMILGLVEDQRTYFRYAQTTALALAEDPLSASSNFAEGKEAFVWILATLFVTFGVSPLPGLMLNAVLVSMLPALLVSAGRNFGVVRSGHITGWLATLSPPIILWGPGLKREALVFALLGLLLFAMSLMFRSRWLSGGTLAATVTFLFVDVRSSLVAVCGAGVIAVIASKAVERAKNSSASGNPERNSSGIIGLAMAVCLASFLVAAAPTALAASPLAKLGAGIPSLSAPDQKTAVPHASWEFNSSLAGFFYNLFRSSVGPMPLEVTNSSLLFFWLEGLGYGVFFSILLLSFILLKPLRRQIAILVVSASPLVVAASLILSNYGLNSRIRAHIFVILLMVVEPFLLKLLNRDGSSEPRGARNREKAVTGAIGLRANQKTK